MTRPVLLHSGDQGLLLRIGGKLGERLGWGVKDLYGESWGSVEAAWDWETPSVTMVSSEVLLDRARRVEQLARATVVALGSCVGGSRGGRGEVGEREGWGGVEAVLLREFREAHVVVGEGRMDEGAVVERIAEIAERGSVVVAAGAKSYLVEVGEGIVEREVLKTAMGSAVMLYITDANVDRLHGARLGRATSATGMRVVKHVLLPGEEQKRLGTLGEIFDRALEGGVDRSSWVVAAGGGVTTDIGGLVAALWMRGVRWVGIPTTLLGMVDASVGGKTAVDHGEGKNAVGAFWQPSHVICDVEFLRTESERNYVGGLAEVVKTAVIGDRMLFEMLKEKKSEILSRELATLKDVVQRCVQVKARIVGLDEREGGLRAVLNLGHTIGHALEALGEFRRYTHGEAVSIGVVAALNLGVKLGHTPRELAGEVEAMLAGFGLPVRVDGNELHAAAELLGHDKKRAGNAIQFVFARDVGDAVGERIGLEELRELVAGS